MFDHVQIKVLDLARTRLFYEATLAELGYSIVFDAEGVVGIGTDVHNMFEIKPIRVLSISSSNARKQHE